jgi:serine/threonine protein kinase
MAVDTKIDPRIETILERYRAAWKIGESTDIPLDTYILDTAKWSEDSRRTLFRLLLIEERKQRHHRRLSISFEDYFDRPWFPSFVDDVVGIMIEPDYRLERRLGSGGQGRVYLVRNRTLHNRREAMKIFLPIDPAFLREFAEEDYERLRIRFERESEVLSKLRLEHLPQVYALKNVDGLRFFTMQYIVGQTLDKFIASGKPLPLKQAVEWTNLAARTLAALHSQNVLHRDFKPSNVLIDEAGNLFLVDFGLIKVMPGARPGGTSMEIPALTSTQMGCGSEGYVSPEQSRAGANVEAATDVFSLGATFYHLVNGFPPMDIRLGERKWNTQVPNSLRQFCDRCLEIEPSHRPTADDVAQTMQSFLDGLNRENEPRGPNRRKWIGATMGTGVAIAAGCFVAFRKRTATPEEIWTQASILQESYLNEIFDRARIPDDMNDGGWFRPSIKSNRSISLEVLPHVQTIASCLGSPNLSIDRRTKLIQSLAIPFKNPLKGTNASKRAAELKLDSLQKPIGWISRDDPKLIFLPPIAWELMALAQANPKEYPDLQSSFERTMELEQAYRPRTNEKQAFQGWSLFPSRSNNKPSFYATGLMLHALVSVRVAFHEKRLTPVKDVMIPSTCENLIKAGSAWLESKYDRGWTENPNSDSPEAVANLGLFLHSFQLRAAISSGDGLPLRNPKWDMTILEKLTSSLEKSGREEDSYLSIPVPRVDGGERLEPVPIEMLWYPWALSCAALLIEYAQIQGIEPEKQLYRILDHLIRVIGPEVYKRYTDAGDTYRLIETIMGLGQVLKYLAPNRTEI